MDIVTHGLVGLSLGELAPKKTKYRRSIGLFFGILPDITNLVFVHPYLGWMAGHKIPFATSGLHRISTNSRSLDLPFLVVNSQFVILGNCIPPFLE